MFRAMFQKEFREIRWIFILAVAAQLYLFAGCLNHRLIFQSVATPDTNIPFDDNVFPSLFISYSFIPAIILGFWQTLGETIFNTYSFLLHRPANRSCLLGMKISAGYVGCLVPGALSILIYGIWAATPGTHLGPFQWRMTIPCWVLWLNTPTIYLGAFLSGIRPGRWYVTRLLPLFAAGVIAFYSSQIFQMYAGWTIVLFSILVQIILVAAILAVAKTRDYA
jgi:hypothetical protein